MNKNNFDLSNLSLDPKGLEVLKDLKKRKESGEVLDPDSSTVLNAISLVNRIMTNIGSGGQVDPAYLKGIISELEKIDSQPKEVSKKKIIKKRKFKSRTA